MSKTLRYDALLVRALAIEARDYFVASGWERGVMDVYRLVKMIDEGEFERPDPFGPEAPSPAAD